MPLDPVAVAGVVLGGASCAATGASLVYFRRQTLEARRQSEVSSRVAVMQSNLEIYDRVREVRSDAMRNPRLRKEWLDAQPSFNEMFDACGGIENFMDVRKAMDIMQDVYYLRRAGVVTDHHWHGWTNTTFRFYSKMPTFLTVFEFAARVGILTAEFAEFYRAIIEGKPPQDPWHGPPLEA